MDTQERIKQQRVIQSILAGMNITLKQVSTAKSELAAALKKLNSDNMYSAEYVSKQTEKLKADYTARLQNQYAGVERSFEDLRKLITERDSTLELTNPAFNSALMLIQTLGTGLSYEQAAEINKNFQYDQKSLAVLRDIYKARGITADGGIDRLVYNVDETIDSLKKSAVDTFTCNGSINNFASQLSKFAHIEGSEIEKMPDQQGFMDAVNRGAGLPLE